MILNHFEGERFEILTDLIYILLFLTLGLTLSSLFGIIIHRIPNSVAIVKVANFCPNCKVNLKKINMIPVVSYLRLGGKCNNCKEKISLKYPAIEILIPVIFVFLYLFYGIGLDLFLNLAFWSMLFITFLIDLEHMVVSDAVLIAFSPAVIVYIVSTEATFTAHLIGFLVGFAFFLVIYLLTKFIYKQEGFGFGDVMLSGTVGWFLGFENVILTNILSFLIAFIVIVFLKILGKSMKRDMEIPFAPFICISAAIASLFGEEIISLYWGISSSWI